MSRRSWVTVLAGTIVAVALGAAGVLAATGTGPAPADQARSDTTRPPLPAPAPAPERGPPPAAAPGADPPPPSADPPAAGEPEPPAATAPEPAHPPTEDAIYTSSAAALPPDVRAAMTGVSWHPGCPVGLDDLALLELRHWGFDGQVHTGRMVVAAHLAETVSAVFGELFAAGYPIERMEPVDAFDGDDDRSMEANNTHAFNCRPVEGTDRWSEHAFGAAIDINPVQNPYVRGGRVSPDAGTGYLDRSDVRPGMIVRPGPVVDAFDAVGWGWGGDWRSVKDYHHFSAAGR